MNLKVHEKQMEANMYQAHFTKSLTVSLKNEVYQLIKEISDTQRISIAELVREILDAYLSKSWLKEK